MRDIKVALIGVGNCASSLVEGIMLYSHYTGDNAGLRSEYIGGYSLSDITVVAAFDVSDAKVGKDLSDAIYSHPNCTIAVSKVDFLGVTVMRGLTLDGISETSRTEIIESAEPPADVVQVLRESGAQIVVSYLPVGSDDATYFYANAALEAGCGYINCMPTPVASTEVWETKFKAAGLPLVGDDVKSQIGATVLHRALVRLFLDRGVDITRSYQLNVGGNADFRNMHTPERGAAKEGSKLAALESLFPDAGARGTLSASVGYVPSLGDQKTAYIHIDGAAFGRAPVSLEVKLDVWDSPNSAGVVVDAIRFTKLALDAGNGGAVVPACAYLMKSPPIQMDEVRAMHELEEMSTG